MESPTCGRCGAPLPSGAAAYTWCSEAVVDAAYAPPAARPAGGVSYDHFADKIGMVPNVRAKDNAFQALVVGITTVVGIAVFSILLGWPRATLLGALLGLVLGGLGSSLVLTVRGLRRN